MSGVVNNRMRQSIDLDDDVRAVAEQKAKDLGKSIHWVINNGMRQSLGIINEIGG